MFIKNLRYLLSSENMQSFSEIIIFIIFLKLLSRTVLYGQKICGRFLKSLFSLFFWNYYLRQTSIDGNHAVVFWNHFNHFICKGKISAVIARLMSKWLWSRWKWWRGVKMNGHHLSLPSCDSWFWWKKTQIEKKNKTKLNWGIYTIFLIVSPLYVFLNLKRWGIGLRGRCDVVYSPSGQWSLCLFLVYKRLWKAGKMLGPIPILKKKISVTNEFFICNCHICLKKAQKLSLNCFRVKFVNGKKGPEKRSEDRVLGLRAKHWEFLIAPFSRYTPSKRNFM